MSPSWSSWDHLLGIGVDQEQPSDHRIVGDREEEVVDLTEAGPVGAGDPHRFKSVRQVGAYAGLVTRRYQSGAMDRSGRISKAGCRKLRKLLVEIAWGMLRHNPHGAAVFNRISKGQKTRRKQAAVALGRRVLCWCWAMLRDGTEWHVPALAPPPRRTGSLLPSPCG